MLVRYLGKTYLRWSVVSVFFSKIELHSIKSSPFTNQLKGYIYCVLLPTLFISCVISGCNNKCHKDNSASNYTQVVSCPAPLQKTTPLSQSITILIEPCWDPVTTLKLFQPISDYLSKETGTKIQLKIPDDIASFMREGTNCDFIFLQSYALYLFNERHEHSPLIPLAIALDKNRSPLEYGYFVVRATSKIRKIRDLRHKSIIFGYPISTQKYFAAYITLMLNGIDPAKDLSHFEFGGTCRYNALSVYLGQDNAGLICQNYPKISRMFNFKNDLRIIGQTIKVPNWIFAARSNLSKSLINRFRAAILKLKYGTKIASKILIPIRWYGFQAISGDEITEIQKLEAQYHVPNCLTPGDGQSNHTKLKHYPVRIKKKTKITGLTIPLNQHAP